MKILIADDDVTSRLILQTILTKWGYELTCTSDGEEAFAALQQSDAPQLVILDWEMPGWDGTALCRKLREQERKSPLYLILLTSRDESGDIVQGLEAGADDYITKPFNNAELRARVHVGQRMIMLQNKMREQEKLEGVLEMAGAVCHELNQPLQVAAGFSEMLLTDIETCDPKYTMLANIKTSIDRLGELTRKIMKITYYKSKPYLKSKIIDIEQASQDKKGENKP